MTNHHNKIIHHNYKNNNNHHHLLPPPLPTRTTSTIQACAACRYQRRKCAPDCILAPYFPHDRQRQFQNAHKLFGVSNITKIIRNLDRPQKDEAMRTIIYQSDVRSIDPVGGCYRIIRELQRQIEISCAELDFVLQQLALYRTLSVQSNNQQFNHDLIVIDEIDYDIHLVNNQDEPLLYDDCSDNHRSHDLDLQKDHNQYVSGKESSGWDVVPIQSWSSVHESPTPPAHASVCEDFKSLLINEVPSGERDQFKFKKANQPRKVYLMKKTRKLALIKVENVCYNEEQFETDVEEEQHFWCTYRSIDHKAIHVEGEYYSS